MSEKPVIFISHSSHDKEVAQLLKQQIELCFDNNVEAFAADIYTGENWFDKVMIKLNQADAIVVLITPNSVGLSHWVWFELGYFWARHDDSLKKSDEKKKIYYPLFAEGTEWPNPVKDLQVQAACLNDEEQVLNFFQQLCGQFEDGDTSKIDAEIVIASTAELASQAEKSEWYIKRKLEDYLMNQLGLYKDYRNMAEQLAFMPKPRRNNIFLGMTINYADLDKQYKLPNGSAQKYLIELASSYGLEPEDQDNTGIKFKNVPKR